MATHWAKEQVHRNELAAFIERLALWVSAHREAALGVGGTLLAALFLGVYSAVRYRDLKLQAWEKLAIAQTYAFSGQGKTALEQLQAVREQYPRTQAAGFGDQFQGDLLFQSGDYKGSIEAYHRVLDRKDPGLLPYAHSGIAFAQEGAGQPAAAVEAAQNFLSQYQDHFLAPQVHAVLARSLKALGRDEEAKATLEKIALLYPETFWAQWANNTLHPRPKSIPPLLKRPASEGPASVKASPAPTATPTATPAPTSAPAPAPAHP